MDNKDKEIQGYALVFVAGILWGTIGVFVKRMALLGADAYFISFLRVFLAFLVMMSVTTVKNGFASLAVNRKQLFDAALLGIVCHGIYNIFYSYAVSLSGVAVSAVLLNIAPVVTMLFSAVLFSEKITVVKVTAVIINIAGCVLTVTGGSFSIAGLSAAGIGCGIGAGICYAMTAIFGRYAMNDSDAYVSSTYSYLFAALLLFIPGRPWMAVFDETLVRILINGLLLAVIPTGTAYVLYYKGVSMIRETGRVPVIASGETIVAAALGVLIYHEGMSAVNVSGIVLVMISIIMVNLSQSEKTPTS